MANAPLKIRFKTQKDLEAVRKAAKSEDRSMNQFVTAASLAAARAKMATQEQAQQTA